MVRLWWTLVLKELTLERKQKYALNGILLYVLGAVFICYLSFSISKALVSPLVWNALLWLVLLFAGVNAIAKSFVQESSARDYYYHTLFPPTVLILAKITYNVGLMVLLALLGFCAFVFVMGNPVQDLGMYLLALLLGALGFANSLTLLSGIASKARQNTSLMAILSFPVIIPILLMVIQLSKNAIDGLAWSVSVGEVWVLVAINVILGALSYVLFPFLWKN